MMLTALTPRLHRQLKMASDEYAGLPFTRTRESAISAEKSSWSPCGFVMRLAAMTGIGRRGRNESEGAETLFATAIFLTAECGF